MAGYIVEKHGFTKASLMMADVIAEMLDNGFEQKFPAMPFDPGAAGDTFKVTMEATVDVDPLAATQPWRIYIEAIGKDLINVIVATVDQLADDGTYTWETNGTGAKVDIVGAVGGVATAGNVTAANLASGFINRETRVGLNGGSYPLSYSLAISPRGLFIGSWESAVTAETSSYFNWILVQRPVNRDTGAVIVDGKAPVWCVNTTNDIAYQFVVRESDILRPGKRRSASINEEDSEAVLNIQTQVRLTEDGKYVVNFPSRLNTSRYRYPHELDMIGATSADVVAQFATVELEVYGENDGGDPTPLPTPRSYKALQANDPANTGMRILVLQEGGGIDPTP